MGTSQMLDGRGTGPSTLLALPNGYFVLCPAVLTTAPRLFFLSFGESSFRVGPIVAGAEGADTLRGGPGCVGSHWSALLELT